MQKLVWRVTLVAELRPGVMTETEVARIEREEEASVAYLGLRLTETKQLTAALLVIDCLGGKIIELLAPLCARSSVSG